jgi:hypothetical protein
MFAEMAAPRVCLAMRMEEGHARSGIAVLIMHLTHGKTQGEADGS